MHISAKGLSAWRLIITGALAGGAAGVLMLAFTALMRWLFGLPSASELIFDRSFPLITINFFIESINWAGGYVPLKINGALGSFAGQVGTAALGGVIYAFFLARSKSFGQQPRTQWVDPRGWRLILPALGIVWIGFLIFLWPTLLTHYHGLPPHLAIPAAAAGLLVDFLVGGIGIMFFYQLLLPRESSPPSSLTAHWEGRPRRGILFLLLAAGAGGLLTVVLRRLYVLGTFGYDGNTYEGTDVEHLTPNEDFYSVTKNLVDPDVNKSIWQFEVAGFVASPKVYSFEQITAMPAVEQETTLMCISNPVGGGLISNAKWKGVPLPQVLKLSEPKTDVQEIVFHASDGYYETVPYRKAMEPTTLLAYSMNDEPLPQIHGYPLRMITPGLYGERSPKWITKVELIGPNDSRLHGRRGYGFYQEQGWGPNIAVPVFSRIDNPENEDGEFTEAFEPGEDVELTGMAFSGDRGIQKVELSVDDGKTWSEAEITEPGTNISWSFWSYHWTPAAVGTFTVAVRAYDAAGNVQIADERPTVPQGATGLHKLKATVES